MPGTLTKSPVQVYLRQDQLVALRQLAERRGVSVAELVRQGVDRLLIDSPLEDDPLWGVVNLGRSEAGDLALQHDRHLSEIEARDNLDDA